MDLSLENARNVGLCEVATDVKQAAVARFRCLIGEAVTGREAESVAMVARGDAQLSVQPVSEILHVPGVELAGPLRKELEYREVCAAAIIAGSKQGEAARRLIAFLASETAAEAIRKSEMEPSRRR